VLWQLTKVVLLAPLFASITFGMAAEYTMQGNDVGLGSMGGIFAIPFADVPKDGSYAQQNVMPAFPALTLLIPPLLAAVGLRLLMYVGVSSTINIVSQYTIDSKERPKFLSYISTMEIIAGVAIFWIGFNMFFSSSIDYNTRYAIAGTLTLGATFIGYGFLDRRHARVIIYPNKRYMYSRLFTAAVIVGLAGSIMIVNNSIASTNKELDRPYIVQQIEVNRYMHGLDGIEVVNYDVLQPSISPSAIQSTVEQNSDVLGNIRLWDEATANARLAQELGQRSDLNYIDFDLLRFEGSMYWTGTTAPVEPPNVAQEKKWFAQHKKYTHSDIGMKMLDAYSGSVVDESQFFSQRRVYYGESGNDGLFSTYWSAYVVDRQNSEELGGVFYNGTGGVDIAPPLSWMFEPNFMVSDPGTPVHVMRYKDILDRMELLYPYFVYEFCFGCTPTNPQTEDVEAFPVTDGTNTYWLMPLVVAINTSNIPWSSSEDISSSFMLQLVGYSLIDTYNGTVQIIVTGDDYFSEMFLKQYADIGATKEVPEWLADQIRYPEEMFIWQVSKFNLYHVTDPETFIDTKDWYAVPDDSAPQYTFAKLLEFESPEFIGLQPLQLNQPQSSNLVGYVAVQNDLENLGNMTFYSMPTDSLVKFIEPASAKTTLTGSPEYKEAKKALFGDTNPPIGEISLYKVGDYEVYFIPVFADASGKQTGIIGAVGASSTTGTYHVGLGDTPAQAFENYLQKLSGLAPLGQPPARNQTTPDSQSRIQDLEEVFTDAGLTVIRPTAISAPVEFREAQAAYRADSDLAQAQSAIHDFIQEFAPQGTRVYEWQKDATVNFGVLHEVGGIVENHYISIEVG
jgi:hypothetical protein